MKIKRTTYFKIITVSIALIATLVLLDAFFNVNKEGVDKNMYQEYNDSINVVNKEFALKNPYGFTDSVRKKEKPDSVFRIAVIGDSFIWGDGLPYEKVWSHKLEKKINEKFNNIETLSWGLNGWSTLNEYDFFIETGYQYNINLLVFAFVNNDTDMGYFKHMSPLWYNRLSFIHKIFPRLTRAVLDYLYNGSYKRWMDKLFQEENLKRYQVLLTKIKKLENTHNTKVLFVLTPNIIQEIDRMYLQKVESLLKEEKIECLNLFLPMQEKFGNLSPDSLKANPANPHPGDKLTEFYADETLNFLLENNHLDSSYLKR